jgi:hypothetical protein
MNLLRPRFLIPLVICVLLPFSAFAGPFLDAEAAYTRGDYGTAYRQFKPLAEHGYGGAQYMLGVIYANSKGVTQDYSIAAKWYRKATEQGVAHAQYDLGNMYYYGQGVPQDYVLAYMWWDVAALWYSEVSQKDKREQIIRKRYIVASKMTPAQIKEAHRLAREWKRIEKGLPGIIEILKTVPKIRSESDINKLLSRIPFESYLSFISTFVSCFLLFYIVLHVTIAHLRFRCPYCGHLPAGTGNSKYAHECLSCGRPLADHWWKQRKELRNKPWPSPN